MSAALVLALMLADARPAAAQYGVYGRLDGDLTVELLAGGGVAFEPMDRVSGSGAAEVRFRFLDTAGLMIGGEVRPEGASRVLLMADIRPLFLPRFLLGYSVGDRWVDLFLDSIGIDLGLAFAPLDERGGVAFAVGFGVDLPLVFFGPSIEGLSLRLFGRHVASVQGDRFGPSPPVNDWVAGALLVLRLQTNTGLPAWEPQRYRVRQP